tara:strand:- start:17607 stop:19646 length:2040 start_codon:yes stop_codon:yes gene_type:complete
MIATKHGRRTTLPELRAKFSLSLKGMTLSHLIKSADSIGFVSRPVRCELSELGQLRLPAILHWDLNHYVVLSKSLKNSFVIHDPAKGIVTLTHSELSKHFTGVALELTTSPTFEKKTNVDILKIQDLWSRIEGFRGSIIRLFVLSAILQMFALIAPLINQIVVDESITKGDINLLQAVILGFSILLVAQVSISVLRGYISMYLGNSMTFQMESNLFRHLLRLPAEFFEKRHIGDIVARFGSLAPVQNLLASGVMGAALDGLMAIGTLVFMLVYAPQLTFVVFGFLAISFLGQMLSFPYIKRLSEERIRASAELQSYFLETIRSIRSIKMFVREEQRHAGWQNHFAGAMNLGVRLTRFGIFSGAGNSILSGSGNLLVLYLGARSVIAGEMTLGMLFAFQAYRASFVASVTGVVNVFMSWRMVGLHLERLSDIARADAEEPEGKVALLPHRLRGNIVIENLRFRYGDNEPWVIDGLSMTVGAGERVAITGRSGGGKSTLMKLLLGLYPVEQGRILYDGRSISQWGKRAVRTQIGVVMQDDRLLSGSLAENIAFFDTEISFERVVVCAKLAAIHEEIEAMPMGYQSLVGDMGSALSAGQIQRLLLARALYPDPAILMLDEGTANLDSESERSIVNALEKLNLTQIIIAHREQAIAGANRTLNLIDGRFSAAPSQPDEPFPIS